MEAAIIQTIRAIWMLKIGAVLLVASPFSLSVLNYLRDVTIYGKLRHPNPQSPAAAEQVDWLSRFSLPGRVAWTLFYAWGSTWNLLWIAYRPSSLPLLLLQAHLLRRVYESLCVTAFSSPARRHAAPAGRGAAAPAASRGLVHPLNAAVGLAFYTLAPPSYALDAPPPPGPVAGAAAAGRIALAVALFAAGFVAQHLAHRELAALRRRPPTSQPKPQPISLSEDGGSRGGGSKPQPRDSGGARDGAAGDGEYRLPNGPLFRHVSCCPHYTAEVAIYAGLWLASGPGAWGPGLAAAFTLVNLSVTAVRTRRWYADRFGEAAVRGRAAILPGIL